MPLSAFLITRFPAKNLYLTGIGLFIAGLAVCVTARNFTVMMTRRVLRACGNGILTSMAQVVLLTIYPIEKKGPIVGWYGLSVGATPVDEKVFSVGSLPMDGIKMSFGGDSIAAGFLWGTSEGLDPEECARFACAAASCAMEQYGVIQGVHSLQQVKRWWHISNNNREYPHSLSRKL